MGDNFWENESGLMVALTMGDLGYKKECLKPKLWIFF